MFSYQIHKHMMKLTYWNNKVIWIDMTKFENLEHAITYALLESEDVQTSCNFIVSYTDSSRYFFKIKFFGENFIVVENHFGEEIKVHKSSKLFAWLECMGLPNCDAFRLIHNNQIIAQYKKDATYGWLGTEIGCSERRPVSDVKREILNWRMRNPDLTLIFRLLDSWRF